MAQAENDLTFLRTARMKKPANRPAFVTMRGVA
jgi:hypothetical protein